MTIDSTMVSTATSSEFHSAFSTPENDRKNWIEARLNEGMPVLGKPLTSAGDDSVFTASR